jgi:hypothetical protein
VDIAATLDHEAADAAIGQIMADALLINLCAVSMTTARAASCSRSRSAISAGH